MGTHPGVRCVREPRARHWRRHEIPKLLPKSARPSPLGASDPELTPQEAMVKENVGRADQAVRSILGPALIALGATRWGGRRGRVAGLAAMIAGALVTETAVTRTCPLNALLGVDTARLRAGS